MVLFAGVLGTQILLFALPNMPALQRISVLRDHWVAVTSNTTEQRTSLHSPLGPLGATKPFTHSYVEKSLFDKLITSIRVKSSSNLSAGFHNASQCLKATKDFSKSSGILPLAE